MVFKATLCAVVLLMLLQFSAFTTVLGGTETIYSAPSLSSSDSVQYFYLESSFPYNTPQSIKDAAGSSFLNYGISHAGLGVWDTTNDVKFTVEFLSNNYVGGLLPVTNDNQIQWQNAASVVITNPMVESNWLNSRLVSTATGSSWNQLVTYLQDNEDMYQTYQPVTAMYVNASLLTNSTVSSDDVSSVGRLLLRATNSFSFVDDLITQLGTYGCSLASFLQIYATSFDYLARSDASLQVVSWSGSAANPAVYNWYAQLRSCYQTVYDDTVASGGGATYFQTNVRSCYGDVAYLYRSGNSVFNMSLAPATTVDSTTYATPLLTKYLYSMPPDGDGDGEGLSAVDYAMIAVFFLLVVAGALYFLFKLFGKKERRRVSFEGEHVATRTVNNLVGADAQDDHEDKAYYHGKKRSHMLFSGWGQRFGGNGGGSKAVTLADRDSGSAPQQQQVPATLSAKRGYHDEEANSPRKDTNPMLMDGGSLKRPLTSAECR